MSNVSYLSQLIKLKAGMESSFGEYKVAHRTSIAMLDKQIGEF